MSKRLILKSIIKAVAAPIIYGVAVGLALRLSNAINKW